MGWKISWVGFHGLTKSEILAATNLKDTGEPDEHNETPFSGAEIPGGWYILFSNDFGFVTEARMKAFSSASSIVACQVHEGVMVSAAYGYERGKSQWMVIHNSDEGMWHLEVSGSPPPAIAGIRDRLSGEQEAAGGETAIVDFIFDVPVELAQHVCGFRHDRWKYDWGQPKFTVLADKI